MQNKIPSFLESFENLAAHFDEHFGELGSNERGDTFLDLALKVVSLTVEGQDFPELQANEKKSHDDGVDLHTATTLNGRKLCVQSKYKVRGKDDVDNVISKFRHYETKLYNDEARQAALSLEGEAEDSVATENITFAIITASKLEEILRRYENSTLASLDHYQKLKSENRLIIIDGPQILSLLQQLYKKTNLIPSKVVLRSQQPWHKCDDIYLGSVPGQELIGLYRQHGDALFFENIRDFLGTTSAKVVTTRSTVNQEIIKTITSEPGEMFARNNGLTFRTSNVTITGDHELTLDEAGIVNGCQTTMCLVRCDPVSDNCLVQVKIVQTQADNAWDVAKAANYQNQVTRVDLDLARYLRPQLVRRVATALGYSVEAETSVSASSVLNTIYRNKINYEELRLLVLGLFSRRVNNLFDGNYTEVRGSILEDMYGQEGGDEKVFEVLLLILKESKNALELCEKTFTGEEYAPLFKRFLNEDRPKYRIFFAIASLCASLRTDVSDRSEDAEENYKAMQSFFAKTKRALENEPRNYHKAFLFAYQATAESVLDIPASKTEGEVSQMMSSKIKGMAFSSLYRKILMRMDVERSSV